MHRISRFFGSVLVRLALIFGALAAMTTAAIVIGWMVFQSIANGMSTFTDQSLPALRISDQIVEAADKTKNALSEILITTDAARLPEAASHTDAAIGHLQAAIEALPEEERQALQTLTGQVETSLQTLIDAKHASFTNAETVSQTIADAYLLSTQAGALLHQTSDAAFSDLIRGGDATIESVGTSLARLIEEDFTLYQSTLAVRAEVNLLSGLALSRSQTRDRAMMPILDDLSVAAGARLDTLLGDITNADIAADAVATINDARARMQGTARRPSPADILSARQEIDAALSALLDEIYFELVINSEDAVAGNEEAIRSLLNVQVTQIRENAALSLATRSFFASAMQVALAQDAAALTDRASALLASHDQLVAALVSVPAETREKLEKILIIADPNTGIAATRKQAFATRQIAEDAAHAAAAAVQEIAREVGHIATRTQGEIYATANLISAEVQAAKSRIQHVGLLSLSIVALAPLLIWLMISRPLTTIIRTTERLAGGDLSRIEGLDQSRGEFGRIAAALRVFRTSALERIDLQEQEQRRQQADFEAHKKAQIEKERAAEQARADQADRARAERERKAEEAAREEELRRAAEAERKARSEEQALVVDELAQSLRRLSAGDLSHTIEQAFPGGYEALRQDYNAAICNLSALVRKIEGSAGIIDASTSEVSTAALDLSRRTESAAATLEQTAVALNELTSSVDLAAASATEAKTTVSAVRSDVEASQGVMQEAVNAMGAIEQSSTEISRIVEVIDDISFQTNLLALNAGVEAARAGETGRGFAVVASEVRSLAQRCSEAALEIGKVIAKSSRQIERGAGLMDQSNAAMQKMMIGIADVTRHVTGIANSAKEQSFGIKEINVAVADLDRFTQQNAAMFQETTAASQSLTGESQNLSQVVAGFSVGSGPAAADVNREGDDQAA